VTIRHRSLISSRSDGADEVEPLAEVAEWVAIAGGVDRVGRRAALAAAVSGSRWAVGGGWYSAATSREFDDAAVDPGIGPTRYCSGHQ
jgi:hypothetical protein